MNSNTEQFPALVVDVRLESTRGGHSLWQIALDRTEFREGDTGEFEAHAKSGTRLHVPVLRVAIDPDGAVWHIVEKPLNEGTKVIARVLREGNSLVH